MPVLLIVDVQNDFVPGGALSVPHGDEVVPVVNRLQKDFDRVLATKDWHPPDHGSFAANHPGKKPGDVVDLNGLEQILWPMHCVQGTPGSDFVPELNTEKIERIFYKGTDPGIDSYSALYDNAHRKSTGLSEYLKQQGLNELHIVGLATDYCVKFSVLDALDDGFMVHVHLDGCRGINLNPGDVDKAVDEMRAHGAVVFN